VIFWLKIRSQMLSHYFELWWRYCSIPRFAPKVWFENRSEMVRAKLFLRRHSTNTTSSSGWSLEVAMCYFRVCLWRRDFCSTSNADTGRCAKTATLFRSRSSNYCSDWYNGPIGQCLWTIFTITHGQLPRNARKRPQGQGLKIVTKNIEIFGGQKNQKLCSR